LGPIIIYINAPLPQFHSRFWKSGHITSSTHIHYVDKLISLLGGIAKVISYLCKMSTKKVSLGGVRISPDIYEKLKERHRKVARVRLRTGNKITFSSWVEELFGAYLRGQDSRDALFKNAGQLRGKELDDIIKFED